MRKLQNQLQKAQSSAWHRWWLNFGLMRIVPFNAPHRIKITEITDESITVKAPYTRRNLNHIRGVHACLLATVCEYVTGLGLLAKIDPREYRIILKSISMEYHYQAKTDVSASFTIQPDWLNREILTPLKTTDKIFKELVVDVVDAHQQKVCTGRMVWQIKSWKHVNTKL